MAVVGMLAPPWRIPAPGYGGAEAVIDGLCRGLVEAGHEVRLWATTDSTCPVPRSGLLPAVEGSGGWHSAPTEIRHVLAGYDWLASQRVNVVHDHTFVGPLIGPHRIGVPVVTTNHLPFTSPECGPLYAAASEQAAVVAVSHAQAAAASQTRIARVIHHGTDVRAAPFGMGTGDADGRYAAFLGRMAPEKGVHEAARAARVAGVRLVIAARMEEALEVEYYETRVRPLLGEGIEYIGEIRGDRKLEFLAQASALVNPISWPEPFGLVMIEALACGTPVVALRGGAVNEIVDDGVTGAVCDDIAQLTTRLTQLDLYDRMACRRVAEGRFSVERMVAEYVDLYLSLIEAGLNSRELVGTPSKEESR